MEKNKNTEPEQPIENILAGGEDQQSKSPPSRKATSTLEENILPEAEDNITNGVWQPEKLLRKEIFLTTWSL